MRAVLGLLLCLFAGALCAQRLPVGAEGKRVLAINFATQSEGKEFDRDPDSAARYTILKAMRTREGHEFSAEDLAADIKWLTTESHLFRDVRWRVELDEKLNGVRVKLIFLQPLVWRVRIVAIDENGVWSEQGVKDAWRFTNRIDTAKGSEFSIARLNDDLKRLYETRGFLDIRPEYVYGVEGVDVLFRVIQNEPLAGVTFSGINETGFRGDLIDILKGTKRARELPNAPDKEGLVGPKYFEEACFDFDITVDADSASILGGAKSIEIYYEYVGYPFVQVKPRLVKLPLKFDAALILKSFPDLDIERDIAPLEKAHSKGAGGKLVLMYQIFEGPHTLVGDITFTGIENIEAAPGTQALTPWASPPGFGKEIWALWYLMPWTKTVDRRARALKRRIKTESGGAYVDDNAVRDAAVLQTYLRERGWREAEITLKNRRFNDTRTRVSLEYELRPGPYYAITNVRFEYATRAPRVEKGARQPDFDKPVASFEELLDLLKRDGLQLSSEQAEALFGKDYVQGLSAPAQGKYFGAFMLEEPLPYDNHRLTGDPDSPLDRGVEGRIRDLLAKRVYSNISLEFEPVFIRGQEAPNDWELPTPVRTVSLIVRIDQGYKSRVGLVTISGNEETRDDVIRRLIALHADEDYDRNNLELTLARLRRTQWFEQQAPGGGVRHRQTSRLLTRADGSILEYTDFQFEVVEGRTGTFNVSAGYNTGTGFSVSLDLEKRNFNIRGLLDLFMGRLDFTGAGQFVALKVQPPVDREQRYSLSFNEPYFFGYPVEVGFALEYTTRDYGIYTQSRAGIDPYIAWHATPDITLSLGYSLADLRLFDIGSRAPEEIRRDEGSETLSAFTLGARYDTRDNVFFATRGLFLEATYRYGGGIFGGTLDFWRLTFDAKYHIPLVDFDETRTLVLAFAFNARWQDVHSDTKRIPFSQRFLLGGNTPAGLGVLRGFKLFGVGPSRDRQAIGGNFITTFTTELRFPVLPGALYLVAFIDAGELTGSINTYDPRGITVSGGFGIRIVLPILPVPFALDFGFPIYNQPGNREEVISINLGFGF